MHVIVPTISGIQALFQALLQVLLQACHAEDQVLMTHNIIIILTHTSSSVTESTTSGTDDDFLFPCTPNFKHSDGVQRVHTSAGARLPTPSQPATQRHSNNHSYHPYRRPPSFQESHIFDSLLGRADTDDSTMSSNLKVSTLFLRTHIAQYICIPFLGGRYVFEAFGCVRPSNVRPCCAPPRSCS
jgi:hypothetical protein